MTTESTLIHAKRGECYRITHIDPGHVMHERLAALGIRTGTRIEVINRSCLRGPVTIRAGKSTVAVGHGMASRIEIEPEEAHA